MKFTEAIDIARKGSILKVCTPAGQPDCVLVWSGEIQSCESLLVRVHSSCLFAEAFGADDCDCGLQIQKYLDLVSSKGGLLIYFYEEGRGEGIETKCRAIALQQKQGLNTADAYRSLGLEPEARSFSRAIEVLRAFGAPDRIRLATNNPEKLEALRRAGFVATRAVLEITANSQQTNYIHEKEKCLGHLPKE